MFFTSTSAPEEAVLLEPMGVAHNGVERLDVAGEDVLVIGCGPVGLLGISIIKAMGSARYCILVEENINFNE